MKKKEPKHIKEIIQNFFHQRSWGQRIKGYYILDDWKKMVPKKFYLHTQPIKIQNSMLFIRVKNHVWANELRIRKGEILAKINQRPGSCIIKDIVIRIEPRNFQKK